MLPHRLIMTILISERTRQFEVVKCEFKTIKHDSPLKTTLLMSLESSLRTYERRPITRLRSDDLNPRLRRPMTSLPIANESFGLGSC